jgi:hypothetical protein
MDKIVTNPQPAVCLDTSTAAQGQGSVGRMDPSFFRCVPCQTRHKRYKIFRVSNLGIAFWHCWWRPQSFNMGSRKYGSVNDQPSSTEGIHEIGARMQERATQLETEQSALQEINQKLRIARETFSVEENRSQEVHRCYLASVIQSHSMELESNKMRDSVKDRIAQTKKLLEAEARITEEIALQEEQWKNKHEVELAQHGIRKEIYSKYLSRVVQASVDEDARKTYDREIAARLDAQMKREHETIVQTQREIRADVIHMTESEDKVNQHVESLAEQVRAALAKVSTSR